MATPVSICNQALGWLGSDPLTSLNDRSNAARLCRDNYDELRKAVLEDVDWSFARRRMTLTAILEKDENDWSPFNRFQIPNAQDVLHVTKVFSDVYARHQSEGWSVEGDTILADESRIFVIYTFNVEDTTKFSPSFSQALAARLAADLAIPIASSRALQQDMWNLYNSKVAAAAANDGSQGRNEKIESGRLVRVRGR